MTSLTYLALGNAVVRNDLNCCKLRADSTAEAVKGNLADILTPRENLFFKCCGDPMHWKEPLTIMAVRVRVITY